MKGVIELKARILVYIKGELEEVDDVEFDDFNDIQELYDSSRSLYSEFPGFSFVVIVSKE